MKKFDKARELFKPSIIKLEFGSIDDSNGSSLNSAQ